MNGVLNGSYNVIMVYGIEVNGIIAGNWYKRSPYTFIPIFFDTRGIYVEN
jgi:hypothetical protein